MMPLREIARKQKEKLKRIRKPFTHLRVLPARFSISLFLHASTKYKKKHLSISRSFFLPFLDSIE